MEEHRTTGSTAAPSTDAPEGNGGVTEEQVREALKHVIDPELGINIVDLGLVYEVEVSEEGSVHIDYTLTTMGCPIGALSRGSRSVGKHAAPPACEPKRGLSPAVVEEISALKSEPDWMRKFRLKALKHFEARPMPWWGADLSDIDFDNIYYFIRSTEKQAQSWKEPAAYING